MNVFVAGGTGVLGKRAVARLVEAGHEVTAVSRSPERDELLRSLGATPVRVDLFDPGAVKGAVAGHDAVLNLATAIPPTTKAAMTSAWADNERIRRDGSRNLVDAALAAGATRYVQESITFNYADGGDGWLDEDSPVEWGTMGAACEEAEAQASRFAEAGGSGVVLRFGMFYGPDGHHMEDLRRMLALRIAPQMTPDGYISSIATDDAATAVVAALGAPSGTYNVVDDEPLLRREWAEAAAEALGQKRPVFAMKAAKPLLKRKADMLLRSQRVSNRRFKEVTGWAPAHPSVREGFRTLLA
jgi:nucleoside-diphosphate-sugar epimerase